MNIDPTLHCTGLCKVWKTWTSLALSSDKVACPAHLCQENLSRGAQPLQQLRIWFLRAEKHQDFTLWLWPHFPHRHWLTRVLLPSPHLPHGTGLSWDLPPCVTEQRAPLLAI